jgi:transcriptional regulator with XRE-family HTH domain
MPSQFRVAGYPPEHIFQAFHKFKDDEKLTESKALIRILSGYFGIPENVAQEVITPYATSEQLQTELLELRKSFSESLNDLQVKTEKLEDQIQGFSKTFHAPEQQVIQNGESLSNSVSSLEKKVTEIDAVVKEIQKSQSRDLTLTTSELAKRLGMADSSLSHWKSDDPKRGKSSQELLEATRAKDPEGIGWILLKDINRFKPERPISSSKIELQGNLLSSPSAITQPEA